MVTQKTKIKIYKSLIRPVLTYGAESWTLTGKDAAKLRAFERKIIRRIYGGVKERDVWRIRNNKEINIILESQDIVKLIKAERLRWLGHIWRMREDRTPNVIYRTKMEGKRRPGRPRNRWGDETQSDLDKMKIINWKIKAQDRERWRELVREAKAHPAL